MLSLAMAPALVIDSDVSIKLEKKKRSRTGPGEGSMLRDFTDQQKCSSTQNDSQRLSLCAWMQAHLEPMGSPVIMVQMDYLAFRVLKVKKERMEKEGRWVGSCSLILLLLVPMVSFCVGWGHFTKPIWPHSSQKLLQCMFCKAEALMFSINQPWMEIFPRLG